MISATGSRIAWSDLPEQVQAGVAGILGSPVVSATSQAGGFSPGTADRVVTASGRRAFVKAVSPDLNDLSPELHRREARVAGLLPPAAPAPRLLGAHDDGHWVALVLEDVEGLHPVTPWDPRELGRVLEALDQLARVATPAPSGLRQAAEALAEDFAGWSRLRSDPPPDLDPWARHRLDSLCAAASRATSALAGDTLVHFDVRADNLLLRPSGGVALIDWPWACAGPVWLDRLLLLINVRLYGGHDTEALLADLVSRTGADRRDLIAVLTGMAGFFLDSARQPAPPGLPTLRAFQRAQGDAVLSWLAEQ